MTSPATDSFEELIDLIQALRGKEGCPWDKQQTPQSISRYLTEEVYELVDAVESGNLAKICEELGDVLFHVLFLAELYREKGCFDIAAVARRNTEKMTRRHPHVFGSNRIDSTDEVRRQWHQIKQEEKRGSQVGSALDSVPVQMPALMRAYRISERAASVGFDWADLAGVMEKAEEEWAEFKRALENEPPEQAAMEFGDILFTLTNVARFARIHPETALGGSVNKFIKRFQALEEQIRGQGGTIEGRSAADLDAVWRAIKAEKTLI
jgi:tetrapyrrole methylase family protein/MazG family protein